MIDKFSEVPNTEQGLRDYIRFAKHETSSMKRRANKLENNIQEAQRRLEVIENGRFSANVSSKA